MKGTMYYRLLMRSFEHADVFVVTARTRGVVVRNLHIISVEKEMH